MIDDRTSFTTEDLAKLREFSSFIQKLEPVPRKFVTIILTTTNRKLDDMEYGNLDTLDFDARTMKPVLLYDYYSCSDNVLTLLDDDQPHSIYLSLANPEFFYTERDETQYLINYCSVEISLEDIVFRRLIIPSLNDDVNQMI